MKKILLFLLILIPMLSFAPATIKAASTLDEVCDGVPTTGPDASTVCSEKGNTTNPLTGTGGLLLRAARFLARITGIASVIVIIYGSIKYITSGGVASSVESAKNTIVFALVGLAVSLASQGIIIFVINRID